MYCTRTFLANHGTPSTASVICYDGPPAWNDKEQPDLQDKFLKINSCSHAIRLHQTDNETDQDFIDKLKKLRLEIDSFITYLERKE